MKNGKKPDPNVIHPIAGYPMTDIDEEHYVIEVSPIRLKWVI